MVKYAYVGGSLRGRPALHKSFLVILTFTRGHTGRNAPTNWMHHCSFSFCLSSKNVAQALPLFFNRSGTFTIVKSVIFTPCSICFQVSGIDTVALGFARAVNTEAKLLPRAFCIQST